MHFFSDEEKGNRPLPHFSPLGDFKQMKKDEKWSRFSGSPLIPGCTRLNDVDSLHSDQTKNFSTTDNITKPTSECTLKHPDEECRCSKIVRPKGYSSTRSEISTNSASTIPYCDALQLSP